MRLLCLDGGSFGDLVRASCPLACGLCEQSAGEAAPAARGFEGVPGDAAGDSSDEVALLSVAVDPEDEVSYAQRGVTAAGPRPPLARPARAAEPPAAPGRGEGRRRNASAAAGRTDLRGVLWLDVADNLDDEMAPNATASRSHVQNATSLEGEPGISVTSVRRSAPSPGEERPEAFLPGGPRRPPAAGALRSRREDPRCESSTSSGVL
ncbi:unnamed protein product [Prorocentrum cordatum]|uniref:ShKT domain-containing protein n=1 Tax=Prorocentrum cordatum TaxID=2364126 RepID=A0ABN9TK42_9DINO|nr:unnamed protein product [Polarella glacialis]